MKWMACVLLYFLSTSAFASNFERANTLFPRVSDLQIRARSLPSIGQRPLPKVTHVTTLTAVILSENLWEYEQVVDRLLNTAAVYLQCGLYVRKIDIYHGSTWKIDGIAGIWSSSNSITNPVHGDQVKHLGRKMIEEGIKSRPALIYIQEQLYSVFGASFARRDHPNEDADLAVIPHAYVAEETYRKYVPKYISADYLGEAHELGHLFGLEHENPSPLMSFALFRRNQQNNYLLDVDCKTVLDSHLVTELKQ